MSISIGLLHKVCAQEDTAEPNRSVHYVTLLCVLHTSVIGMYCCCLCMATMHEFLMSIIALSLTHVLVAAVRESL